MNGTRSCSSQPAQEDSGVRAGGAVVAVRMIRPASISRTKKGAAEMYCHSFQAVGERARSTRPSCNNTRPERSRKDPSSNPGTVFISGSDPDVIVTARLKTLHPRAVATSRRVAGRPALQRLQPRALASTSCLHRGPDRPTTRGCPWECSRRASECRHVWLSTIHGAINDSCAQFGRRKRRRCQKSRRGTSVDKKGGRLSNWMRGLDVPSKSWNGKTPRASTVRSQKIQKGGDRTLAIQPDSAGLAGSSHRPTTAHSG